MGRAETEWTRPGAAARYEGDRFRSRRARARDPRLVARLLRRFGSSPARVLDLPAGTGRLAPVLGRAGRYVAADVSAEMLSALPGVTRVRAHARALPFRDASFDAVVCCRLLHHLGPRERAAVIAELVRVSRGLVIASFWDARSLAAWRRRAGLRRASHPDRRIAVPREAVRADLEAAGASVLGFAASLRFVSPQTFVAAQVGGA